MVREQHAIAGRLLPLFLIFRCCIADLKKYLALAIRTPIMRVFTTVHQLQNHLKKRREKKGPVAFVPTLGALHAGHLSLMKHAQKLSQTVVVSIFVNPTQFNDPKDLEKYPRPLAKDIHLLTTHEIDVLFVPTDDEVYPPGLTLDVPIDITSLTNVMEGPSRPGHFEGVVTVVKRLLDIVKPDFLVMGQKDYQQQAIIGSMIEQLDLPIKLVIHPTERDRDGLALSSRNTRIDPILRKSANSLYKALEKAKALLQTHELQQIIDICSQDISQAGFELEYFAIVHPETLQEIPVWNGNTPAVACVAAWLGDVRLIDNMVLSVGGSGPSD